VLLNPSFQQPALEWCSEATVGINSVTYVKPYFSNSRVDKAAEQLLSATPSTFIYRQALGVINQWRSSHLWPLAKVRHTLKNRSGRVDKKAIVVQRLKRLPSIENKLTRLQGTRLTGMQDIGGCRSIVADIPSVYSIAKLYRDARDKKRQDRSALVSERDYIRNPQVTGYRGVHLVIRYQSLGAETKNWTGRKIEIQLRTRLQHSWATALESMSTFLRQQLKSGFGDPQWLRFFALARGIIAEKEDMPPVPKVPDGESLYQEALGLWRSLNVRANIDGCAIAGDKMRLDMNESYFVMKLDSATRVTTVWGFSENQLSNANVCYNDQERLFARQSEIDVVLVRADDIKELKTAYPNYWADATEFSSFIQGALEKRLAIDLSGPSI